MKSPNQRYKVPLFFWFNLFLEARAETLEKFVGFLGDLKTPKRHFKINRPLLNLKNNNSSLLALTT
jgi:hypothetical protein